MADIDLLHPPLQLEKAKHKLKRLVPSPNSMFLNNNLQPCPNGDYMCQLLDCLVSAYWWTCQTHRGMLFQGQGSCTNCLGIFH